MYVFFDCETGGLDESYSLLSFAAIATDAQLNPLCGGTDEDQLYLEIAHPTYVVAPGALEKNGINLVEHSKHGVPLKTAQEMFYLWLSNVHRKAPPGKLTAAGHNVPFDQKFVWAHLMPPDTWKGFFGHHTFDTMPIAHFLNAAGLIKCRCNLGALCDHFKIPLVDAHNAMADTLATVEVARRFMTLVRQSGQ